MFSTVTSVQRKEIQLPLFAVDKDELPIDDSVDHFISQDGKHRVEAVLVNGCEALVFRGDQIHAPPNGFACSYLTTKDTYHHSIDSKGSSSTLLTLAGQEIGIACL